jgi:hypothetical protein
MGTVFKKTFTKPLPAGAELFTREGQQFARWNDAKGKTRKALVTTGKKGEPRILFEAKTYTAKYRDRGRIVREVSTGCRDEQAARSVLADLERRAELVKAGVMTVSEDEIAEQQFAPLADHFIAFDAALQSKGRTRYTGTMLLLTDPPDNRRGTPRNQAFELTTDSCAIRLSQVGAI